MKNNCGERIKKRLLELNISQADLCRQTGINSATMSQYISGKYYPTQKRMEIIAKALKTTPAYLMGWSDMLYLTAEDNGMNELLDFIHRNRSKDNSSGYSYDSQGEDSIGQLINTALGLDDNQLEQLIKYAEFLSQEKK